MTADREALVAEVAGMLAQHREDYSEHCCWWHGGCNCGWTDSPDDDSSKLAYDTHLADALADLLAARDRRVRAGALREAADRWAEYEFVEVEWLRSQADEIEADA